MRKFWILAPACVLLFAFQVLAAPRANSRTTKTKEDAVTVELFDAIKSGDIEVRVIAKDAAAGNVLIKNKTAKPLSIKLPEAVAAVPVAAQFVPGGAIGGIGGPFGGGGMNGMMGGNGMNGAGANQTLGGGFPGMNGGMNGGMNNGIPFGGNGRGFNAGLPGAGFPGGLFKVEPEKVGKLKMTSVCLEHGKPDPNPHIEYELRPLDEVAKDPRTIEAVRMLARGEIDQKSAQAAAWHLANGLTWEQLAGKIGVKHITGQVDPFFSGDHIARARKIAEEAKVRASSQRQDKVESSSSLAKQ